MDGTFVRGRFHTISDHGSMGINLHIDHAHRPRPYIIIFYIDHAPRNNQLRAVRAHFESRFLACGGALSFQLHFEVTLWYECLAARAALARRTGGFRTRVPTAGALGRQCRPKSR
jgi:hypothetical protein